LSTNSLRRKLIGICGGSGSGKSLLASAICDQLNGQKVPTTLIHLDRYFLRDISIAPTVFDETLGGRIVDFNHPGIVDTNSILSGLIKSHADVTIVEGHLLFALPEIRKQFDYKVFLDVNEELRLNRRLKRDLTENRIYGGREAILRYAEISARPGYQKWIEPTRHHSNLILNGELPVDVLVQQLLNEICDLQV